MSFRSIFRFKYNWTTARISYGLTEDYSGMFSSHGLMRTEGHIKTIDILIDLPGDVMKYFKNKYDSMAYLIWQM